MELDGKVLAVVGPSADDASVQAHTYHGTPSEWLTTLGALRALVDPSTSIITAAGCDRHGTDRSGFGAALAAASRADAVVFVGGLDEHDEEEDTDRADFRLPGVQAALIEALAQVTQARRVPFGVVIFSGGPISEPALLRNDGVDSLFWSSYSGQTCQGMAEALLGLSNPSGALPFTIPLNESQLGPMTDYSMSAGNGRTYRYLNLKAAPPLFPFGFGLSYSNWKYGAVTVSPSAVVLAPPGSPTLVSVRTTVTNVGSFSGMLVVQLYARFERSRAMPLPMLPKRQLLNFTKIGLEAGESAPVQLEVDVGAIISIRYQMLPSTLHLWLGNADEASAEAKAVLQVQLAT